MSPPLSVEVRRGPHLESVHQVDVAVVGLDGHRSGWGDPSRPMLARSAMKPIQAVPLVATGAAAAFGLGDRELALACASHSGEPAHIEVIDAWVARLGLGAEALACGADGRGDPRYNTCSGNHCGYLTVARHLGLDQVGYVEPDHPLQADHVTPAIEALCGVSLAGETPAIDGCGIPVWPMRLDQLALGWARLSAHDAGAALLEAMTTVPFFVAGTDRACTSVMSAAQGRVAVKFGAEGVYAAVAPADGLGIALKCRDGATRAAEAALSFVLADLGLASPAGGYSEILRNLAGVEVGEVRVVG